MALANLPFRHALRQGPVIAALGTTALTAVARRLRGGATGGGAEVTPPASPGPEVRATLAPRSPDLVRDYVRSVGGDPAAYRGVLPPHLFPQWAFPLQARALRDIRYPLERVLNAGCRVEVRAPLPAGEPLVVSARLEDVDANERRAILHQRVVTGTRSAPEALVAHVYALVPLARKDRKDKGAEKEPARVPERADEVGFWRLPADAGLSFAMLTGDFNPVHWVPAYARAFGFKSTILHGFATMARAWEGLQRALFAGAIDRISTFDVKFTRPLVLPASVGLYVDGQNVYVGDGRGGAAYLSGTFEIARTTP